MAIQKTIYDIIDELTPENDVVVVEQLLTPDQIYQSAEKYGHLLKEDRRIERKAQGIHVPKLGEYFSMWANTSPHGGLVVVGIADSGEVLGCKSLEAKTLDFIRNKVFGVRTPHFPWKNAIQTYEKPYSG
jgi:hypothetical protein